MLVWRGRGAAPSGNGSWRRQGARSLPICASLLVLVLLARAAEPAAAETTTAVTTPTTPDALTDYDLWCHPGYYVGRTNITVGPNTTVEAKACMFCPMNTYMDERNNAEECKQCPHYAFTGDQGATSLSDCWCGDDFVGELGAIHTECKSCAGMDGVSCTRKNITVESGYYKPPGSYEVYECNPTSICNGGLDLRWGYETECKEGNSGPKCAVCEDDYYSYGASGCIKCGSKNGALAATGGLVLGVMLLYWAIFRCVVLSTLKTLSPSLCPFSLRTEKDQRNVDRRDQMTGK